MKKDEPIHELTYELIKRATSGDREALSEILEHYDAYINALVAYETVGENGEVRRAIDEDMKAQVQLKLVEAIKKWKELI